MIAFGPVPSRRLGYSLGINHIPPKHCTYSCAYCQVGRTTSMQNTRQEFYPVNQIIQEVEKKIWDSAQSGQVIDFLSLVPDGEPTLDIRIGELIERLKQFQIPIAVISNASLIDRDEIQEALLQADWVSLKVDSVDETEWRQIDRPHRRLSLPSILTGILKFRIRFQGELVTETMLVSGINDNETSLSKLSAFLLALQPFKSYFSIPTRPPAETWAKPPDAVSLQRIITIISKNIPFMDLLFEAETADFSSTGNLAEDIIGIVSVHPLREAALRHMVAQAGADWMVVEELIAAQKIACIEYREEKFYLRRYPDLSI